MLRNKQRNVDSYKYEKCFTPLFWQSSESIARTALITAVALERYPKVRLRKGKHFYWAKRKRLKIAAVYSKLYTKVPMVLLNDNLPKKAGIQNLGKDYILWVTQSFRVKNA